jgi:hypothetical protein
MPARLSEEEYDRRISEFGKAKRVASYINCTTPIDHLCLIHGETWPARPGDIMTGHGMKCCGRQSHDKAKAVYENKLAQIGLCEAIEPYVTRRVPILHRCLRHGKTFLMAPKRSLEARVPPCCGGMWRGSLYSMLLEPKRWGLNSKSVVYAFKLAKFPDYIKIGISANIKNRINEEYGDFIAYWHMQSRFQAFLVEQAALIDSSLHAECPEILKEESWAGWTEVRKSNNSSVVKVIQFYVDALTEQGEHRFILNYLKPSDAERELCLDALDLDD